MCTRILWNTNDLAVLTARTMDWPESTQPLLVAMPRGRARNGGLLGDQVVDENPLTWTSRYGSLVTTIYGIGTIDGFNERGLAAHGLYLEATDFGDRDGAKPAVHSGLWVQYLLDQAGTVSEALALMDAIAVVLVNVRGFDANIHVALEDAGGDSAIIELADGVPMVHHGREFTLMTNDPTYDEQLQLLAAHDFSHPTGVTPLPGNVNAVDRFQRAAYFSALLPEPAGERQAVAAVMAVARNVSVPFGAPYEDFGVYNTEYRTVCDLTNRTYYFELTTSPSVLWAQLDGLDIGAGVPPHGVDPYDETLAGDVTSRFAPVDIRF
ncbi:linear amide C-N hydrolase [Mycolicibacterium tokaiense]|uniref:Choloylglycine hydrolase n=1 Tax=Mycolicibacterium tokaiense TaxID=39695 RepID=A0A378TKL5_9MYCO|nr:linear amide C-N hydrolase [Mycolicibacterium tokaiense]BBY90262.1 choloylglycine hydrolase [Mycolicibacterium tokaiense]STZ61348.1 Choloylglycine hydrolase [Mycolicibacterium tokaiense]